jgi:alcohol dehydrogenase
MALCPIPLRISELGVPREALPRLAAAAMTVTRLLKNNPRPLTEADALALYESAW